jgi:uncharacterized protein YkwD
MCISVFSLVEYMSKFKDLRAMFKIILLLHGLFFAFGSSAQRYNQPIDPFQPNYEMLNESIFRATNEVRAAYGLRLFEKDSILQSAAQYHANAMIKYDFYGHKNPFNATMSGLFDRVLYFSGSQVKFGKFSENIAQIDLIATDGKYCIKKQNNGYYRYYNCTTGQTIPLFTYKELAITIVGMWMSSPGHRKNILDAQCSLMGASVGLSPTAYRSAKPPFVRVVQNFGMGFIE